MTKLTVAALQLAFTETGRTSARSASWCARRPARAPRSSCRPSCSKAPISAGSRTRACSRSPGRPPSIPRCWRCRSWPRSSKISIPTSFFEADGPHHYNTLAMVGPDGKVAGRLPQEPYPRWPGLRGEVLFPPRQHRLQGVGRRRTRRSASACAGTNGIPKRRGR